MQILQTNLYETEPVSDDPESDGTSLREWSTDAACLFKALFQPAPLVIQKMNELQQTLFGAKRPPYVAIHFRFGGAVGEDSSEIMSSFTHENPMLSLMRGLQCARTLKQQLGIKTPVIVIMDFNALKIRVASGVLGNDFQVLNTTSMHTSKAFEEANDEKTVNGFIDQIAEMGILGGATCMVTTGRLRQPGDGTVPINSGFAKMAFYLQGGLCSRFTVTGCA